MSDISNYVDLAVYDRTAEEVIDRALADAAAKLPGWQPRHGNTEVVLLEGVALEVAELVYAINRLPSATMRGLLALYGVLRSDGVAPVATVTFALSDNAGHTIPAGTVTRLDLDDDQIRFTTNVDLVVAAGAVNGTVAVTGDTATDEANGVPAGTALEMVTSVVFVNSATLATPVSGGADPEGELTWLDRGSKRLARLTDVLVHPSHFTARVLEDVRVLRAITIDNTRGDTGATAGGHVTVAVAGSGGVALSGSVKLEIEAALEADALANLNVWVNDPTVTAVAVTAAVKPLAGFANADVIANVNAALAAYLNPDTWEWGGTVRRNELIAVIDRAAGVDYVASLTDPAADVALAGLAPLASSGVRTITIGA